jgi:methylated-DNA-[protein]-cysteine S-methyltransferase
MKEKSGTVFYSVIQSPIGELMLVGGGECLAGVYFCGCKHTPAARDCWTFDAENAVFKEAEIQLNEYFAGRRNRFSLPLRLNGTDFQKKIWSEIARIPYGETLSYSALAERAGAPRAIRAAGTSTGRNPLSIVIPCHRVMGKNGSMCGFAGGLQRKQRLLELERSFVNGA